jgi:DNA-directed RNA polymerase subunit L
MKVSVLKRTDNELKIEVEGAGHSLLNLLQKTLLEDDTIEMAGYDVPHPLVDSGILYIRTKEKQNPEAVIREATKKVHGLNKKFHKSFKKASKDYKQK